VFLCSLEIILHFVPGWLRGPGNLLNPLCGKDRSCLEIISNVPGWVVGKISKVCKCKAVWKEHQRLDPLNKHLMTFPIEKRINNKLSIDGTGALLYEWDQYQRKCNVRWHPKGGSILGYQQEGLVYSLRWTIVTYSDHWNVPLLDIVTYFSA